MTAAWLPGNALAFDIESTGVEPALHHIVSAHALEVGPGGIVEQGAWLVNPGVDIPAEATAIHGITTAKAQAEGLPLNVAIPAIARVLREAWDAGLPVIAMNANFDLTMLDHELWRCAHSYLTPGPVLDPLVIDRTADPHRKGPRKLVNLVSYYNVKAEEAHNSRGDALMAARVVWAQAKCHVGLQGLTLEQMQKYQRDGHEAWAANFEQYLRKQGKPAEIDRQWPMRKQEAA